MSQRKSYSAMTEAERFAEADRLAEEVRQLRIDREAVPDGRSRRTERARIGLQIDTRRFLMHRLNPAKYPATQV